jgi:hypothetical protein
MGKLLETVALVSQRLNPGLKVTGIALCMNEQGTRLASEVVDDLRGFLDESRGTACPWSEARIFRTFVRRNIKLAEAPGYGQSIFEYAPSSNGAWDYAAIAAELVDPEAQLAPVPEDEPVFEPATESVYVTPREPVVSTPDPHPVAPMSAKVAVPEFGPIPVIERDAGTRRSWAPNPVSTVAEDQGVSGLHADLAPWGSWPDLGRTPAPTIWGDGGSDSFDEGMTFSYWLPQQQPAA